MKNVFTWLSAEQEAHVSYKSALQCPTVSLQLSHKCQARVSYSVHKGGLQECNTGVSRESYNTALQNDPREHSIRAKSVTQECLTRVSHKGILQDCPARVPYKSFPEECPGIVFHKSVKQKCHTSVSYKSILEACHPIMSVLGECHARVSNNIWPFVLGYV